MGIVATPKLRIAIDIARPEWRIRRDFWFCRIRSGNRLCEANSGCAHDHRTNLDRTLNPLANRKLWRIHGDEP